MSRLRTGGLCGAATFVVACAMLLQSLTVAWAFSDGASQVRLDAFGNAICNSVLNRDDHRSDGSHHAKLPLCCVFGCHSFGPFISGAKGAVIDKPVLLPATRALFPALPRIDIREPSYQPGNPRAPPASI